MIKLLIVGFVAMLVFMGLTVFYDKALKSDELLVLFLVSGFLLFQAFSTRVKLARSTGVRDRLLVSLGIAALVYLVCGLASFLFGKVSGVSVSKLFGVGIVAFAWAQFHEIGGRLDELERQGEADSVSLSETGPEASAEKP